MASACAVCNLELPSDGDFAKCSKCSNGYHFDCSTVSGSSWRSMGQGRQAAWRCSTCYKNNAVGRTQDAASRTQEVAEVPISSNEIVKQLTQVFEKRFGAMENSMRNMFVDLEQKTTKKLEDFELALNFYGDKVDEASTVVKEMEHKLVLMERRLEKSEGENKELKTRLRNFEIQMNEIAQENFNNQLEITGVKNKNINAEVAVEKILEIAGFSAGEVSHKVIKSTKIGENEQERTTLSVLFQSQQDRNMVMTKIKKGKIYDKLEDTVNSDLSPISINEALCPYYKKLFYEAKKVKKDKNYTSLWTQQGKILLKKTATSKIMRLSCMDDLSKL